jgi:hypothetical protein
MQKFEIDYSLLKKFSGKYLDYNEVKHKLVKVAFDLYKLEDDKSARLWEVNKADDGNYIVALYSDEETIEKQSDWQVEINKTANNVNFYYKGDYVTKLSKNDLGIGLDKANSLPEKLANNKKLVSILLKNADIKTRNNLVRKYPELA